LSLFFHNYQTVVASLYSRESQMWFNNTTLGELYNIVYYDLSSAQWGGLVYIDASQGETGKTPRMRSKPSDPKPAFTFSQNGKKGAGYFFGWRGPTLFILFEEPVQIAVVIKELTTCWSLDFHLSCSPFYIDNVLAAFDEEFWSSEAEIIPRR